MKEELSEANKSLKGTEQLPYGLCLRLDFSKRYKGTFMTRILSKQSIIGNLEVFRFECADHVSPFVKHHSGRSVQK